MRLDFQMKDDILIAGIEGELDHHTALSVREEIDKTIDVFMNKHLVLDFSGVTFMDSSGIGVIMGRYNKVREKGGKIYITGCSAYVEKILDMTGIFTITGKSETNSDAIAEIQGRLPMQMTMEVMMNG